MTDKPTPKPNPHIHWTVSKGEPPAPPEALLPEGEVPVNEGAADEAASAEKAAAAQESADNADVNSAEANGEAALPGIQEEQPRRKSLRERNIIRLLELGDEAVQMRDYRMARKYYNEAKDIFNSRDAVARLRDLDKMRLDYLRSLIYDPSKENGSRRGRGRRDEHGGRRDHNGRAERRERRLRGKASGDSRPSFRSGRNFRKEYPADKNAQAEAGTAPAEGQSSDRKNDKGGRPARRFPRSFGSRPGFGRREGGKPFGSRCGRPFGRKPSGKKSFSKKPFSGRRFGGPRKGQ